MSPAQFLSVLGRNSFQAGVLVLVVLLAQWLFGRQLIPRWRCVLWLLVVVRLMLPLSFASPVSVYNWLPDWNHKTVNASPIFPGHTLARDISSEEFADSPAMETGLPVGKPAAGVDTGKATLPPVSLSMKPVNPSVSWVTVALLIWFIGAAALLAHLLVSSFRLARRFADLPPVTDPGVRAVLEECRRLIRVRVRLAIVESPDMSSPALQGLFRPQLILPQKFAEKFSSRELRYIFLHELAHMKRRDLWLNWLVALLQVLHWFNPLVWLGFARWRADRELACDALAIETAGAGENREYGRTMLRLLENFLPCATVPGMVGIFEDQQQLRQRVQMIAQFRPASRWSFLALLLVAFIALGCLTDARMSSPISVPVQKSAGTPSTPSLAYHAPTNEQEPLMLDLSPVCQHRFVNSGQTEAESAGIAGRRVFDGIPFQVEGRAEIYGRDFTKTYNLTRPDQVEIRVGRKFDELHLLHATYFADVEGQEIAFIRLSYADGSAAELPIRYGEQVRDFQRLRTEEKELLTDPDSKTIWRGPGIPSYLGTQRLFKSRLLNPHPEKLVTALNFISTRHLASYFFAAATVANREPSRPVTPPCPLGAPERHFDGTITVRALDDTTGKPLPRALVQPSIDVDGVLVIAAPLYTSADGEAVIRYPTHRESNINTVVQMPGYRGQGARWSLNFPDVSTFRLRPTNAPLAKVEESDDNEEPVFDANKDSVPVSLRDQGLAHGGPAQGSRLIAYEGFNYATSTTMTNSSVNVSYPFDWGSGGIGWTYPETNRTRPPTVGNP